MPTIDPMQQEAMRRVQAMQSRINQSRNQRTPSASNSQKTQNTPNSQRTQNVPVPPVPPTENSKEHTETTKIPPNIEFKKEVSEGDMQREMPVKHTRKSNQGPIDILLKDKEQNLILLLIVLLAGDGANQNLLLALIYLLI